MTRHPFGTIALSALFLIAALPLLLPAEVGTRPLAPRLFLITGLPDAGNIVFLKTGEGVIVVDSGDSAKGGKAVADKIQEVVGEPIRFIILTDYHGDHTYGLQSFPPGTVIIGQDNIVGNTRSFSQADLTDYLDRRAPQRLAALRKEVESLKAAKSPDLAKKEEELKAAQGRYDEAKQLRLVYPQVTFSREITVRLGGETVRVHYPGPTHTSSSAAVYFETEKVLHTGDMLFYRFLPFIDWEAGSDTANWIAALQELKKLDFEKVVPGHGEVAAKPALDEQIELLTDLRSQVKSALAQGLSLEDMQKRILFERWKGFGFSDLLPSDIEAVYHELKR